MFGTPANPSKLPSLKKEKMIKLLNLKFHHYANTTILQYYRVLKYLPFSITEKKPLIGGRTSYF